MAIRIGPNGTGHSLVLEGELDMATADQFLSTVELCRPLSEVELVIDCTGLVFVDGAGARSFVELAHRMPMGSRLVLRGATGITRKAIELLRLGDHPSIEVRR